MTVSTKAITAPINARRRGPKSRKFLITAFNCSGTDLRSRIHFQHRIVRKPLARFPGRCFDLPRLGSEACARMKSGVDPDKKMRPEDRRKTLSEQKAIA